MSLLFLGITGLLLAILEQVPQLRFRESSLFRRYFISDVIYLLTGYIAVSALSLSYIIIGSSFVGKTLGLPQFATLNLPLWAAVPLALVVLDLGQYISHYLLHRYDILWEFHKAHHSSPVIDWLATFRAHFVEQIIRRVVGPLLLIVAGFPVSATLIASGIFIAWAEFNHANLKLNLRFLEPVFITPRLHKVHHVPGTMERNLGTVFTIWDRLRGTLVCADPCEGIVKGPVFGNGEPDYPQTWAVQLVEPIRRMARVRKTSYKLSAR